MNAARTGAAATLLAGPAVLAFASGGFFATHPGTEDRIDALKKVSAR